MFLASSDSYVFSSFPVGTEVVWNDGEWGQVGKVAEALLQCIHFATGWGAADHIVAMQRGDEVQSV